MAATAGSKEPRRLSIRPERTDAHVGVQRDRSYYLTRTEDLNLSCEPRATRMRDEVVSP